MEAPTSLGRLKSRQRRPKVRLRGLHAQSSARRRPERDRILPFPRLRGRGPGREGGQRHAPRLPKRTVPRPRCCRVREPGRSAVQVSPSPAQRGKGAGGRGLSRHARQPVDPHRSSPLSRRSLPGEGPGEGPPAACANVSRTPDPSTVASLNSDSLPPPAPRSALNPAASLARIAWTPSAGTSAAAPPATCRSPPPPRARPPGAPPPSASRPR